MRLERSPSDCRGIRQDSVLCGPGILANSANAFRTRLKDVRGEAVRCKNKPTTESRDQPTTRPMPPLFISLDGIDGTGKSTQCRLLVDWLRDQGLGVSLCIDPGSTAVGAELRAIVLGHRHDISLRCEALLFMASRAE